MAAASVCLVLMAGCSPAPGGASPSSSASSTPTASATTPALDLTQPGVARTLIRELVAASGSPQVVMVLIRQREASVSVLTDGQAHTWAYRGGAIKEVSSDLTYVGQATFDPDAFDLSDIGAVFRAAAAVSGSDSSQELQIVDSRRVEHSAIELKMSVATNPETRTVFFNADGTLVPTLDFNTASGIAVGLSDAIGTHSTATAVTVGSATGAVIEYPGTDGAVVVRMRASKLPVTDVPRSGADKLTGFDPRVVSPLVIWRVLQRYADQGSFGPTTTWSMTADIRTASTLPRLRFTIGSARFVTDLQGNEVKE
jgi:hypothetical protein